jgi:hypothetical protein
MNVTQRKETILGENFHNEGIYIRGGSFKADQVAVGKQARVTKIVNAADDALEQKGLSEIRNKLDELLSAISVHADSLDNRDEVLDSTETVAKELAEDKPNKLTIMGVLSGMAESAKTVAGVATAVQALRSAVLLFL